MSCFRKLHVVLAAVACCWAGEASMGRADDALKDLGAARVPKDAAFLSSSLRLREQAELIVKSRAFATLRELPAVKRAIEAYEEQKSLPGNPLALATVFLELPENKQAAELLADLVSNDSFVYGDPSCITLLELFRKLQETNQVAGVLQMVGGGSRGIGPIQIDGFELDLDEEEDDTDDDDASRFPSRGTPARPVRFRAAAAEEASLDDVPTDELAGRMFVDTLAENVDSIVVPDIVWGFKASKGELAKAQLQRLEALLKLAVKAVPELANSLDRQNVAGNEFVTFTVSGESLPWDQLDVARLAEDSEKFEKVLDRLRSLEIVVAIGLMGDRVILSIGDSLEHLKKLAATEPENGLLTTDPFRPLAEVANKRLTGISYLSEPLARAVSPSVGYLRRLAALSGRLATNAGAPEAEDDVRRLLQRIADDSDKRLPVPGPWMSYAYLGETGYEGASWDWSTNVPLDGSKPLSLLAHTGGDPLAALVVRTENDPSQFDEIVSWIKGIQAIVDKHLKNEERKEFFGTMVRAFGPLVSKLADVIRTKMLPSLADGQIGFVLDAKSRTERVHEQLPAAAEPLPLLEPAVVLGVSDPGVFKEGINDLFDLADEFLDTIREVAPGSVPDDYRIPDPETSKVDAGTIWSFALPSSGLDDQVRPSIALGADAVVFSMVPKQAVRLLAKTPLETAASIQKFEKPLAAGAVLDHAGLLDAIEPWVVYGVRYASAWRRDGDVDVAEELDAGAEDEASREALKQVKVVFTALKCLRGAAAQMSVEGDARVIRWQNLIRDLPAVAEKP